MKKKQKEKRRFPLGFLSVTAILCLVVTYLWNIWYIPYLPRTEIPPFLASDRNPVLDSADSNQSPSSDKQSEIAGKIPQNDRATASDGMGINDASTSAAASHPAKDQTAETVQTSVTEDMYRRRSGVYNILVAGKDDAAANTDVMLLVSFDTQKKTAAAVQIPRDTYLDGYKINALWAKYTGTAKRNGAVNASADGMRALCDTIEETLCVRIDHWMLISLSAFRTLVDAIGGVSVDVPCQMDYDDPAQNLSIHLKPGIQTLDGAASEQFVRFRSGYIRGDLGRVEMQKLFLTSLLSQCKQSLSVLDLPNLMKIAIDHVSTSLSFSDMLFFAKSALSLDMSNVTLLTLPGTDCREYGNRGTWYYILSRQGTWELVNAYLNVYETAIDGKLFDRQYRLTDTQKQTLLSYYQTYSQAVGKTTSNIEENGVSVALLS
ncbi:MAG: LCP family protein [Clostridia bacterium]|nr:LCP family protein [Clostridia bacterium]